MQIIIHRVNKIEGLRSMPSEFGIEVDVRTYNNQIILNHEPLEEGELLDEYLSNFKHAFIVFEIKEEGIENRVINLCKKHNIENYFLLSVSFPFIYLLSGKGIRKLAVRYSEFEDIKTCLSLKGKIDWVWVDTFTKNPLNKESFIELKRAGFNVCIVSPDRWGRPEDIRNYAEFFKKNSITLDAVMVGWRYKNEWNEKP